VEPCQPLARPALPIFGSNFPIADYRIQTQLLEAIFLSDTAAAVARLPRTNCHQVNPPPIARLIFAHAHAPPRGPAPAVVMATRAGPEQQQRRRIAAVPQHERYRRRCDSAICRVAFR
jgi:hypothetical protein